jgi:hypothetical protein
MNNKKYFIGLLSSEDEDIRLFAWDKVVPELIESGIFTEEELKRYDEGL